MENPIPFRPTTDGSKRPLARNRILSARFMDSEYTALENFAWSKGMTLADWVRGVLLHSLEGPGERVLVHADTSVHPDLLNSRFGYRSLAVLMIASPIAAYILNAHILRKDNAIYWVEFCGIWAFAAYWIVKGIEMSGPDTEKKVAAGELYDPPKLNIAARVKSMLSVGTSATTPTPPSP